MSQAHSTEPFTAPPHQHPPPPHPSFFEEEWKQYGGESPMGTDLAALADFNAGFDNRQHQHGHQVGAVDTGLFTTPSTPGSALVDDGDNGDGGMVRERTMADGGSEYWDLFGFDDGSSASAPASEHQGVDDVGQQIASHPPSNEGHNFAYPSPHCTTSAATPYFQPSIEQQSSTPPPHPPFDAQNYNTHNIHPSPLRNHFSRRSYSEPPGGFDPHVSGGAEAPLVFHRQGQYLGKPQAGGLARVKGKAAGAGRKAAGRYAPYSGDCRKTVEGLKRLGRAGGRSAMPTSAPALGYQAGPAVEFVRAGSAPYAMEYGGGTVPGGHPHARMAEGARLMIPISVEQLEFIVQKAVEKAMRASDQGRMVTPSVEMGEPDSDTIVVGGRSLHARGESMG